MPTKREREYYSMGFQDGLRSAQQALPGQVPITYTEYNHSRGQVSQRRTTAPKRKLSAWQKFVKANSKKPRFRYKSGAKKGRVNLKALGVAYRKKRR